MYEYDELKIYRGQDIQINRSIIITQPTIGEIEDFDEKLYFQGVRNLTSVGADLKWQLFDMGIDYTTISDYDLFIKLISQMVGSRKKIYEIITNNPEQYSNELVMIQDSEKGLDGLLVNPLALTMKYADDGSEFDFADFEPMKNEKNQDICLYNTERDITIDRLAYQQIVDVVRNIHGFKRNNEKPANEVTKMDLIEDARYEAMAMLNKPYKSVIKPLVSTLMAKSGQYGDDKIWNIKINMFFDAIKRVAKIQDASSLIQGAYSGFANLKGIDKSRLDMFGDL